jgi:DNA-binding response OmpR family regulator
MAGKILVADVDANIRSVLEYRLRRDGCTILLSANCADALDKMRAERPDLIVLDLALPEPEGSGLGEQLLNEATHKGIPVMALTIYGDDFANGAGADPRVLRVIQKPFSARQLVADINAIVGSQGGTSVQRL